MSILIIDRATLSTPAQFMHGGWAFVEGDKRLLAFTSFDFSKAVFGCPLREDERYITGCEKLKREKAEDCKFLRLDSAVGFALFQQQQQTTLRFLHTAFGVTWIECTGDIMLGCGGGRHFLCLYQCGDGSWDCYCCWIYSNRNAKSLSVRLAS